MNHSLTEKGYETASSWQPVSHAITVTFVDKNVITSRAIDHASIAASDGPGTACSP